MRPVGRAIADFRMIRDQDRVLLGLSGGKDSLSLLHILTSSAATHPSILIWPRSPLIPRSTDSTPRSSGPILPIWVYPISIRQEPILERAKKHIDGNSYCSWCARMKRGVMYATARREGYNVLALAQHLDDLAESFLMSAFHGGRLKTMKANYRISDGDLRVIRPLAYVRERQTRDFAKSAGLPVILDSCPACFTMPTQRQHMKELLASEENNNPQLFKSLLSTIRPLMSINEANKDLFNH